MKPGGVTVVELQLGRAAEGFDLEEAVCSHGLFMMSPNYWHSLSKTLHRPLRLPPPNPDGGESYLVSISHPSDSPLSLCLRVLGTHSLSPHQHLSLLAQVRRMLRLSEVEDTNVKEFQKMHKEARERGFGRMFRSPTLFEDMVKCMLLCNCQWPRTLSMVRALCELQWELKSPSFGTPSSELIDAKNLAPNTPEGKESKRVLAPRKCSTKLSISFENAKARIEVENDKILGPEVSSSLQETHNICQFTKEACNSCRTSDIACVTDLSEVVEYFSCNRIGNFPSPSEISNLGEKFLAKRCGLGYRASRILNLARSIVEGKIQLRQLEEACDEPSLLKYNALAEKLKEINGFGPYTCSNVLMCMGFYNVVPSDSETVRHLNQVHKRGSTLKSVHEDVKMIYGNYAPFQFLAYWWEVWQFYGERFGKLSEMPHVDYKLITASNMRSQQGGTRKRINNGNLTKLQRKGQVKRTKNSR